MTTPLITADQIAWNVADEIVVLRGEVPVRLAVLRLAWDLEARGITLSIDPNGRLVASPPDQVTANDVAALRAHLRDVKRVVAYRAPEL